MSKNGVFSCLLSCSEECAWTTSISAHWIEATLAAHIHAWHTTITTHALHTAHVGVGKHKELHLFLLHVLGNLWVLVDLVVEECCLELILGETVLHLNPVVSDAADQHWHHHWVSSHLANILRLEHVKGKVVRCNHQLDCLVLGQ